MPGIINVDFADIRSVMENAGSALMGIGTSSGEKRSEEAARAAINSPLLEVSITGAKGVLFAIAGGEDLGMLETQDAARVITESIDPHAKVIFGAIKDDKLKKNELKVTVIATGFPEAEITRSHSMNQSISENNIVAEAANNEETEATANEGGRGRIFNSLHTPRRESEAVNTETTKEISENSSSKSKPSNKQSEPKPVDPDDEDDDDDWGAVPAFLRRSKLK